MANRPLIDPAAMLQLSSAGALQRWHEEQEAIAQAQAEAAFAGSAGGAAESLFDHIQRFEAQTDPALEVGVRLVSFGQALTFRVSNVGYTQPNLVWFEGKLDDGSPVRLIQHFSQLSFLLMRVSRLDPDSARRPIGFHYASESG
jgi:hypothetical protein